MNYSMQCRDNAVSFSLSLTIPFHYQDNEMCYNKKDHIYVTITEIFLRVLLSVSLRGNLPTEVLGHVGS